MSQVIGIDHIYLAVRDLDVSRSWYDRVMPILGFRSGRFAIGDDPHVSYYCRHFGFVLRPARSAAAHDPYVAGLHHFCLRVDSAADVDAAAASLAEAGITTTTPALYPQYAPDYYAIFLDDPDGIRLEVTNYRRERRERYDHWDDR
jgi:glyoxylase I family protein